MKRRLFALTLCLAAAVAAVAPAYGQRASRHRAPSAARVDLSGPFARLFPADTFLYVEVADLTSLADEMGGVDTLYAFLKATLNDEAASNGRFPLTAAQFRVALGSSLALAVTLPETARSVSLNAIEPEVIGVVRLPTPEAAALVRKALADAHRATPGRPRATSRTIRGVRVTTVPTSNAKSPIAYAFVDTTLVVGTPAGVARLLTTAGSGGAKRLGDAPGFAAASGRVPGRRQVFAYLNGAPMVRASNEGIDAAFKPAGNSAAERDRARVKAAAVKAFVGLDAVVGGSLSALAESGNMTIQVATELDRSRGGLVSVISDGPPIALRAASVLPADTDLLVAHSVDLVALHDLFFHVLTPQVAEAFGLPKPPEIIALAEKSIGMRLRDEFLAAFGNEMVIGSWVVPHEGLEPAADAPAKDDLNGVFLFEVRNPEAVEAALAKMFAADGGAAPATEMYRDVPLLKTSLFTYAVVEGFGVVGERAGVVRVIDAVKTNETLARSPTYAAVVGSVPNNVLLATFMSPRFFEYTAKQVDAGKTAQAPTVNSPIFFTIQKDATGVYGTFQVPLPNLRVLLDRDRPSAASRR